MKIILLVVVSLAMGVLWALTRMEGDSLKAQAGRLRQQSEKLDPLHRERERLRYLQLGTEELADLQLAAGEHARIRRELATQESASHRNPSGRLAVGRWLSPAAWKNRGQETPTAVVETALWAAAGGDVAGLRSLLQLDDAVRTRASELMAQLPEASRVLYPGPDDLIAAFTTKAIPLGDAQLVWLHESGPDDAVACVFVRNPEPVSVTLPLPTPSRADKTPPMAPPNHQTKSAYLSLRRIEDNWRVIVPMSAVESIAKELGLPARL